jgi:hypothetical protein
MYALRARRSIKRRKIKGSAGELKILSFLLQEWQMSLYPTPFAKGPTRLRCLRAAQYGVKKLRPNCGAPCNASPP